MIVDTEKVLREADGSVKLVVVRPHTDGKVIAPGCASKPDGESREEQGHGPDGRPMVVPLVAEIRSKCMVTFGRTIMGKAIWSSY